MSKKESENLRFSTASTETTASRNSETMPAFAPMESIRIDNLSEGETKAAYLEDEAAKLHVKQGLPEVKAPDENVNKVKEMIEAYLKKIYEGVSLSATKQGLKAYIKSNKELCNQILETYPELEQQVKKALQGRLARLWSTLVRVGRWFKNVFSSFATVKASVVAGAVAQLSTRSEAKTAIAASETSSLLVTANEVESVRSENTVTSVTESLRQLIRSSISRYLSSKLFSTRESKAEAVYEPVVYGSRNANSRDLFSREVSERGKVVSNRIESGEEYSLDQFMPEDYDKTGRQAVNFTEQMQQPQDRPTKTRIQANFVRPGFKSTIITGKINRNSRS